MKKVKYETRLEELGLTTEEEIDRWLKNQTELDQLAMGNTGIYIKSEADRVRAMRDNVRTRGHPSRWRGRLRQGR